MVGLCAHHLRGAVPADTYLWVDLFIINQHPGQQQADDLQQLRLVVRDAAATLVCTDAAGSPFERIWCLFEMWTTLTLVAAAAAAGGDGAAEAVEASGGDECRAGSGGGGGDGGGGGGGAPAPERSRSQSLVVLTTGLSASQRAKLYRQIDAATAKATVPTDKERILADIAASPGGIPGFNAAMRCALLLRPLDYEGHLTGLTEPQPPVMTRGIVRAAGAAPPNDGRPAQPPEWDFSRLDSWLELPSSHRHYRALALLGPPGSGKSSAAAVAVRRMMARLAADGGSAAGGGGGGGIGGLQAGGRSDRGGGGGSSFGVAVAAHFCRANDLQALGPLAVLRTLAYQLSLLFPQQLQGFYAFNLAMRRGQGDGSGDGIDGESFALRAIAGMASAEGGGGGGAAAGGNSGGGGGQDPVAAAFDALLLRPLELLWKSYQDAVQAAEGADGSVSDAVLPATVEAAVTATAAVVPQSKPRPPRLVILLDGVDEGDSGPVGGSHENAILLMLQEHFPRLPVFVRLMVSARPLPHIRALLAHKFDPWVISPADLRPPPAACAEVLAARLARRPALVQALAAPIMQARAGAAAGTTTAAAGAIVGPLAKRLWKASGGWMLFLRLAEDVLDAVAAAATVGSRWHSTAAAAPMPVELTSAVAELEKAAAAASAPSLYALYMRCVVAPAVAAATEGDAGGAVAAGAAAAAAAAPARSTAEQLGFLLEVLGAAREPLYLSQLRDLGLPAVHQGTGTPARYPLLRLMGCLVNVRSYKLNGFHRSLLEWLADGGAAEMPRLLGSRDNSACIGGRSGGGGGLDLGRGHAALAAMALRDVAAARASQAAPSGGVGRAGGARGPRGPDSYSLQHAVAHVLEAAAATSAAGDEQGALALLRGLLLDFYYWRCVYQDGSAASMSLAALLRHEAIFRNAAPAAAASTAAATATAAASAPAAGSGLAGARNGRRCGGGTVGPAAALAADAARWLQSYHGSLLRFPEAVLQTALSLPAASPIRAAALAATAPPRQLCPSSASASAFPPVSLAACRAAPASAAGCTAFRRTTSGSAAGPISMPPTSAYSPSSCPASAGVEAPAAPSPATQATPSSRSASFSCALERPSSTPPSAPPPEAAELGGVSWPRAFPLSNPAPDWDACLLAVDSRGVTRGLAWVPEQSLLATACDDKKIHLLSPVTGGQVGLMEGHTDRVYCVALRPEAGSESEPAAAAAAVVVASGSLDGRVALWDGGSRTRLQLLEPGEEEEAGAGGPAGQGAGGDEADVTTFGFSVVEDRPTGRGAKGSVDCLAFSSDGAWLAAGTSGGSITMWRVLNDAGDGAASSGGGAEDASACGAAAVRAVKSWVSFKAHSAAVAGLAFLKLPSAPDGAAGLDASREGGGGNRGGGSGCAPLPSLVLASCSEDGSIHIWDPRVAGDGGAGGSVDGEGRVATVSQPLRTLRLDSEVQIRYEMTGREPQQRPLAYGRDPWFLFGPDTVANNYSGSSGMDRSQLLPPLAGVAEDVDGRLSRASYRAPEHRCLASGPGLPPGCLLAGSGSGIVSVWDVGSGLLRERLRGHVDAVHCLALQHGGPHFASGSGDCTVRLWRHLPTADPQSWIAALQAAHQLALDDKATTEATHAAATAEQSRGAAQASTRDGGDSTAACDDGTPDAAAEAAPGSPRVCRRPCQWQCLALLRGHTRLITSIVFLTGGTTDPAAQAARYGSGTLAKLGSGFGSRPASGPGMPRDASTLPPTAYRLASASVDFSVRIWQVDHGASPNAAPDGAGVGFAVNTVAVSPDGRLIATGADDFQMCLWDGSSGTHRRTLRCFHGRVRDVAFSRDAKRLAAAVDDGAVLIFEVRGEGEEVSTIGWCRGHAKAATGVAFSPDGHSVASSSEDGTARIWAVRGFQTACLEGHPSGATAVAWAEEGALVATGAARGDPGVQLWDARMGTRINTFRYHVADVVLLAFGSTVEPPPLPPPPPSQPQRTPSRSASAASSLSGDRAAEPPLEPRRHILLMSVDARGLACVWDVWGGGLLHCVEHVQGADLAGSRLLWLQARAMHYADMQQLLRPPPPPEPDQDDDDDADRGAGGGQQRRRHPPLTTAVAALYPPGEAVHAVAAGPGLSCVVAVTDKQRLYIFRPAEGLQPDDFAPLNP